MTVSTPEEFARLVVDEQVALVRRWGDSWADASADLRRLVDGEIDGVELGRSVAATAARDAVLTAGALGRVGVGYWRFVAELLDTGGQRVAASTSSDR